VEEFGAGLGDECVLCVGQFVVGLGERVCAACETFWSDFDVSDFVLYVGEFYVGLEECVFAVFGTVWGSECATGGFVLCVYMSASFDNV